MRVILLCISLSVCGCVSVCMTRLAKQKAIFHKSCAPPCAVSPQLQATYHISSAPSSSLSLALLLPLALFAICACHFTVAFNLFLSKYTLNLTLCCAAIKMLFALLSLLIRPVCLWRCRRPKDTNCWLVIIMTSFLLLSRDARKHRQYVYTCIYICIAPSRLLFLSLASGEKSLSKSIQVHASLNGLSIAARVWIASSFALHCFTFHFSLLLQLSHFSHVDFGDPKVAQLSLVAAALVAFQFIWFLFCSLCCMALFSFFCLVSPVLFMCMYFIIMCALREHKARSTSGSSSSGSGRKTPANRSSDTRVFSIRIRRGRGLRLSLGKYKFLSGHTVSHKLRKL